MMLKLADRVFEFCASLKLAILVIAALAVYLAVGTMYESRYGSQAARAVVYESTAFLGIMSVLAINVLAAVLVRYPWKRKQTGFIITHAGIEVLLAGCLLSYRAAVDGRLTLRPGDAATAIDLTTEQLAVTLPGQPAATIPVDLWHAAGYPTVWRFMLDPVWPVPKPAWEAGTAAATNLDAAALVEVLDWLPAAKLNRRYLPDPAGRPAALVHLTGATPMGMPVDEHLWLHPADGGHESADGNGAVGELFGGVIDAALWPARSPAEAAAFLHPPAAESLPEHGAVDLLLDGGTQRAPVDQPTTTVAGWTVHVDDYFPQAAVKDDKLVKAGDEATDPVVRLHLTDPKGVVREYVLSANYPFLSTCSDPAGRPTAGPVLLFQHPATLVTHPQQGRRGRLQLLQTQDGLLARRFGLHGLEAAFPVKVGQAYPAWMGLSLAVDQHVPAARLDEAYRKLNVGPDKMAQAMRAVHVALPVDGQRSEAWLARGAAPRTLPTPRGPAAVAYGFDSAPMPVPLSLVSAEMTRDPGSSRAAAYASTVEVSPDGGERRTAKITMNDPLTVAGTTFYQSGFDDSVPNMPVTVLSVRRDPGWVLKYAGCALIVGGIFAMFYMKAYFQKPRPAVVPARPRDVRTPVGLAT